MAPAPADNGGVDVELREASPGRFEVLGSLTFASARHAAERGIRAFGASGATSLEADLSAVRKADSAGLAVLICWLAWAQRAQRKLTLTRIPASLADLARISEAGPLLQPQGT